MIRLYNIVCVGHILGVPALLVQAVARVATAGAGTASAMVTVTAMTIRLQLLKRRWCLTTKDKIRCYRKLLHEDALLEQQFVDALDQILGRAQAASAS